MRKVRVVSDRDLAQKTLNLSAEVLGLDAKCRKLLLVVRLGRLERLGPTLECVPRGVSIGELCRECVRPLNGGVVLSSLLLQKRFL